MENMLFQDLGPRLALLLGKERPSIRARTPEPVTAYSPFMAMQVFGWEERFKRALEPALSPQDPKTHARHSCANTLLVGWKV
jgi:hypothetical protein